MSKLGQLRKLRHYETQAPRCINCANYRKPGTFLRDSLPVTSPPICKDGDFVTRPNAICDYHKPGEKQS